MNVSVLKAVASWQRATRHARGKVPGLLGALAAVAIAIAVATAAAPPAAEAQTTSDRDILNEFFNLTGGGQWGRAGGWQSAQALNDWHGVTADGSDNVTALNLAGNNLTGTIPASLGQLTMLTQLRLNDNKLTGTIPASLIGATELTHLHLQNNGLTGGITTLISQLNKLQELNLSNNMLAGPIPAELGGITSLTMLNLSNNQLTGSIPTELGSLTSLTMLNLSHNQLTGNIPMQLDALTNLTDLWVNDNSLSGDVPELDSLTALINIGLGSNSLAFNNNTVPTWVTAQPNAFKRILDLGGMGLSGSIPLTSLTGLHEVYLDNNELTGSVDDSANWTMARKLHLNNNMFTGAMPSGLDGLSSLTDLRLNNNRLTGAIASDLVPGDPDERRLEILHLHDNKVSGGTIGLSGNIPNDLGTLPNLKELLLHGNSLENFGMSRGELHALSGGIIHLTRTLTRFTLHDNDDLTGCLRLPLGLLANDQLDPAQHLAICDEVRDWDALGALYVKLGGTEWTDNTNWFIGGTSINNDWGKPGLTTDDGITVSSGDITSIKLGDFNLKGDLSEAMPDEFFTCVCFTDGAGDPTLTVLELNDNEITGSIPPKLLGEMTALTRLRLDNNQLTGTIPPQELGNLTNLILLWLNDNRQPDGSGGFTGGLTGPIPTQINRLSNLRWLRLNSNNLRGTGLPRSMGGMTELRNLYLYENDLPGTIPGSLGTLTNLETVILHNNRLSGEVPDLSMSPNLRILDLSHNGLTSFNSDLVAKLEGPSANRPWASMTQLLLEGNAITGAIPSGVGNLGALTKLALHRNQFTGAIPDLSGLSDLQELYLSHNRKSDGTGGLSGNIPMQLGSLSNLTKLWLNDNELTGPVPSELGNLTKLTELDLSNNGKPDPNNEGEFIEGLSGGWLANVAGMTSLSVLRLHKNNFSEEIPTELTGSPGPRTLTELRLDDNEFSGNLPAALTNLSDLERLLLHGNNFDDSIPSEWGGGSVWRRLEHLSLDNNDLANPVPVGLLSLPRLKALYLSHNGFTGLSAAIPAGDALSLEELLLEDNSLTAVPGGMARLSNLKRLSLNNTKEKALAVDIPAELAIRSLVDLYLNNSGFTGRLPEAFRNIGAQLATLWLRDNSLECIPAAVRQAYERRTPPVMMDAHGLADCSS